jgi:hypothetical protein
MCTVWRIPKDNGRTDERTVRPGVRPQSAGLKMAAYRKEVQRVIIGWLHVQRVSTKWADAAGAYRMKP